MFRSISIYTFNLNSLLLCFLLCFNQFVNATPVEANVNHDKRATTASSLSSVSTSTAVSSTSSRRTSTTTSRKTSTSTSRKTTTSTTSRKTTTTSSLRTTTSSTTRASTSTSSARTSTSTAAAATSTAASSSGSNDAFAANILQAHNAARASHGAYALTWSSTAESYAKTWAEKCVWQHGGNPNQGQNLAASAGYKQSGQQIVDAWMSEEKDYDPSNPTYSHFTQVVWKSTTAVGCFQATCNKLVNPDGSETFPGYSPAYFTVCNYTPPGNYAGQYAQNVQKNS